MLKKIAIFLPSRCNHVTEELETTGTGAREQIADWLAHNLAPANEVHVFTNVEKSQHYPNLHYVAQEMAAPMLDAYHWDALVSFDFPSVATLPNIGGNVDRLIVSQNYFEIPPEGYTPDVFHLIDSWVFPSEFALRECSRVNETPLDKGVVIPYEADGRFFDQVWRENTGPARFIYTSQAENGLANTLRMWPEIMQHNPGSMLTVACPCDEFVEQIQWSHSIQSELALDIRDLIGQEGVRYIGRQGRKALAKEFHTSDFILFPAEPLTPSEIGSLPLLQAARSGCCPVFTPVDALEELYGNIGESEPLETFSECVKILSNSPNTWRKDAYDASKKSEYTNNSLNKWLKVLNAD